MHFILQAASALAALIHPSTRTYVRSWGFIPLPRYSAYGLAPTGPAQAQALFKMLKRFVMLLELFCVYYSFRISRARI
ncbi:TPA: hypothetical protein ACW49T_002913, partial [Salmonella enterica subsp. enterica serovar Narashino]